jgi:3-methylcrotonyl-CoA carboxylase alpha subunit
MSKPFDCVLIANRGEIACRVIRTCRQLGIRSVAVYSDADRNSRHVRLADAAVHIGGAAPGESYLRGEAILAAARQTGAQAIHPGYGFLSENADFADAVEAAGIVFIGPSGASMRKMGQGRCQGTDGRRRCAGGAGLYRRGAGSRAAATRSRPHRLPADDQGRARRRRQGHAHRARCLGVRENLLSCQREARNAFGRDRVLLERYIESPRHIEIQVFGDAHGQAIHLNERECSAQRRYQKVLEESPSPFLSPELRSRMGAAAVAAARAIDYVNAGTVEFIVGADGAFYFMEINTRLQVEHPVTEMVTGLDLVEWQLRIAAGEPLPLRQEQVLQHGHAIEVRLYAEDPEKNFLPGSGRLERLLLPPACDGVRIDAGVEQGDTVTVFYDPMIAKLIVHAADRSAALARLAQALSRCDVVGPASNIDFLERLIAHPRVVDGSIDTSYLDRHLDEVLAGAHDAPPAIALAAAVCLRLRDEAAEAAGAASRSTDPGSPWALADAWRLGHGDARVLVLEWRGTRIELQVLGSAGCFEFRHDGQARQVRLLAADETALTLELDGQPQRVAVLASGGDLIVHAPRRYRFHPARPYGFEGTAGADSMDRIRAPMPGRIVAVQVAQGERVQSQQALLVMEAMKMELTLRAPQAATVAELRARVGDFVEADTVLVRFEEDA